MRRNTYAPMKDLEVILAHLELAMYPQETINHMPLFPFLSPSLFSINDLEIIQEWENGQYSKLGETCQYGQRTKTTENTRRMLHLQPTKTSIPVVWKCQRLHESHLCWQVEGSDLQNPH